jgi:hypothetical protein
LKQILIEPELSQPLHLMEVGSIPFAGLVVLGRQAATEKGQNHSAAGLKEIQLPNGLKLIRMRAQGPDKPVLNARHPLAHRS